MSQGEQNKVEPASAEHAEIERLTAELSREHDLYLRALADFENYRRRVERERESAAKRDKRALLLVLLDLADDFERALAHVNDSPEVSRGRAAHHTAAVDQCARSPGCEIV